MKYTRVLRFKEVPDYHYLIHLFKNILKKKSTTCTNEFDWNIKLKDM